MKNTFSRWWGNVSIAKKLYFTVGIMAALIAVELFTLFFSIRTLSSVRAAVEGEGLWSKAEKDAVFHLQQYGRLHEAHYYEAFQDFMKVPLGDHKTLVELAKKNPDLERARQGFIEGRNHPSDVDGMISLFRRFHDIFYIKKAISIWAEADSVVAQLIPISEKLHQEITSASPSEKKIEGLVNEIEVINRNLTRLEDSFSYTLGEGSRWLENLILKLLFAVALTVEISGLLLAISVSRGLSKGLNEIISTTSKIATGDFHARAKISSGDEIGLLARAVSTMADDLLGKKNERDKAEEKLILQKKLYETLITVQSELGEGMCITEGAKIVYANAALCIMYGYTEKELFDISSFIELIVPEDRQRVAGALRERLAGRNGSDTGETSITRKDGTIIHIEYSVKKITVGNTTQLVSIIRDITEKIKYQKNLSLHVEELNRSNQELVQFAYVASHDLQEPLRSIVSYLQLIEKRHKDDLDEDTADFIRYAVEGANRMHVLINDLLAYSRIGTHAVPFARISCQEILNTTLANLHNAIEENNAAIVFDSALPEIFADPSQMIQLFQNLIANAIKFKSDKTPVIHISCKDEQAYWQFAVSDNGIGIPSKYAQRVFVIFQRLHTSQEYPGTGIGLAVCKKIVERHSGTIWLESEPGTGTTFFFTIPKNLQEGTLPADVENKKFNNTKNNVVT